MRIREVEQRDFHNGLVECFKELDPEMTECSEHVLAKQRTKQIKCFVLVNCYGWVYGTASVYIYDTFLHNGSRAAHIEDVAISPRVQKMGYGRQLVAHCVEYCKTQSCYKVVLNCSQKNVPFYEKCGFGHTADGFMRISL